MHIVVHDYCGHPFQLQLSRELARRGNQVSHLYFAGDAGPKGSLDRAPGDPDLLRIEGIAIRCPYRKASFVRRRFQDVEYGRALADRIRALRPDVILSGNTPVESQHHLVKCAQGIDAAFVFWAQDLIGIAASLLLPKRIPLLGHLVGAYYSWLERRQMAASNAVIVISEDFAPLATQWSGSREKVHTIRNWGPIESVPLGPKANDWSVAHGLDDKFVLLYSGTMALKHNPDLLAELARHFRDEPRVRIVAVSHGVGMDRLIAIKDDERLGNLHLLPLQPFAVFPDVLASADVLVAVLESDAAVFSVPSKVLSYLCAGRPVLLSGPEQNLASRIVREADAGLVTASGDASGLVVGAETLFIDRSRRDRLAANARAYAEATFDIGGIADRFESVLFDALRAKRSSIERGDVRRPTNRAQDA